MHTVHKEFHDQKVLQLDIKKQRFLLSFSFAPPLFFFNREESILASRILLTAIKRKNQASYNLTALCSTNF